MKHKIGSEREPSNLAVQYTKHTCSLTIVGRPASSVIITAPMIGRRVSDITVSTFCISHISTSTNHKLQIVSHSQNCNELFPKPSFQQNIIHRNQSWVHCHHYHSHCPLSLTIINPLHGILHFLQQ